MRSLSVRPATPWDAEEGEILEKQTPSDALIKEVLLKPDDSPGDLWTGWNGDMEFSGDGSREAPYQISTLSQLMGLSEAVASGTSFEGTYLELTEDIDLGNLQVNDGNWNPIGWYQNRSEFGGKVKRVFKGHFDGAGHTISGLKLINLTAPVCYSGLFGVIEEGTIKHLNIEAGDIYGEGPAGVLAGSVLGDSLIYDVTVSGYVSSKGDTGGLVGIVDGETGRVVIENCRADGIVLNGQGSKAFTGGIAGNVQKADLVDNTVTTQDGDANRIRGVGYVGGIAGRMNLANLYNSYVSGTIGGNKSLAAGGIVGKYESGDLVLARFSGDISRTNNGSASHEGTFVGTRESRHNFTYGTEKHNQISYLYATSASMAKRVFGSNIDGDNAYTKNAHIGYWTDFERKYVTTAGVTETGCGDRYFYEELEDGVRYIVTQKLGREFTAEGYKDGLAFSLDHFAPGYQGEPVRGYLVSVPRIDAKNANGTYDTDVAVLTAIPATNNSWYRQTDKDHPSAIAPGETVSVATAPKNRGENRYQMVYEREEEGSVKPPVFLDENGEQIPMGYVNGGSYTFEMPECDTKLLAEYIKVTTKLSLEPSHTVFRVTQTRTGDRKSPSVLTEVKDEAGVLIARYIDGVQDMEVEVQPVRLHANLNSTGASGDRTVRWSVDDGNLLMNCSESGYTEKDGRIIPNMDSSFIKTIVKREEKAQADSGYQSPIGNTVYTRSAVVTASTNPDTSADQIPVMGNCRVDVEFQILDHTTVRVEGLNLNKNRIVCTITRKLTGDRLHPVEVLTCSEPAVLSAGLYPSQPFYKNVSWSDKEGGKVLRLHPKGDNSRECGVEVRYDAGGKENPAWIQNVMNEDNTRKAEANGYLKLSGSAVHTETVTAASEDQTHGRITASCEVVMNFQTVDETVIHPESITLDAPGLEYNLVYKKTGRHSSPEVEKIGFNTRRINAVVLPALLDTEDYRPYNRTVKWESSQPSILTVNDHGEITPAAEAEWIQNAMKKAPYQDSVKVQVTALSEDRTVSENCTVTLNFELIDETYGSGTSGSFGGGGSGGGGSIGLTPSGQKTGTEAPQGSVTGTWVQAANGNWLFASKERSYSNEWAYIHNPYAGAGQEKADWFRFSETGHMVTGWFTDTDGNTYYLNPVSDGTLGRMMTGWMWIDGKWYCFNEVSDGTRGALLKNTRTPDGYLVDEHGVWKIQ